MSPGHRATYRVQLRPNFGFDEAAQLADYLAELGVSDLYTSPCLQAVPGSTHGYDVVDPTRVSADLGGEAGFDRLGCALRSQGLGLVLDIVPNHMAIATPDNPWWWDVVENGPSSRFASFFDVDWAPPEARLRNVMLLPVLADHYGRVLEAGELLVERRGGALQVRYGQQAFPVAPRSMGTVLAAAAERCGSDELAFVADAFAALPEPTTTDRPSAQRRHRDKEVLHRMLAQRVDERPDEASAIDAVLDALSADADGLDAFLARQNFRLACWRVAGRELGYRRFFDINSLVALRVEDERVFAETHALPLRWVREGRVRGLRIDHPDGLRDPGGYLNRLRAVCPEATLFVEKVLQPGEELPRSWPVDGTTGYEFLRHVGGLFIDPAGREALDTLLASFTGDAPDFPALVRAKKQLVLRDLLGADLSRLAALLLEICEQRRRHRDYTRHELHDALRELVACFPVYRTYVHAEAGECAESDARYVNAAIELARAERPDLDPELLGFLRDLLVLREQGALESELVMRFQQLTGPAMAKGFEDTALYCYHRLLATNEVGGDPAGFAVSVEEFHAHCLRTQERWPGTLLATSTHDTKRSEDVRARLAVLSEIPEAWARAVRRWAKLNRKRCGGEWPDRSAEYVLYQTLVGAWPIEPERVLQYMEKAAREAKEHTSWTSINPGYEGALRDFITGSLRDPVFAADVEGWVRQLLEPGRRNALAMTLLKLTAPGVPDLYQGTELWDLSLVDPDNRRPVDYGLRRRLLASLRDSRPAGVLVDDALGVSKLWVIRQALGLRRQRPELFGAEGGYTPLTARGAHAPCIVAFLRGGAALTVVPRLTTRLRSLGDTRLEVPAGRWRNVLTGEIAEGGVRRVGELLRQFPVALLERERAS